MIKHIDLFSGIGGFALAVESVFGKDTEHIFIENDPFCIQVLKRHWPESSFFGDIRTFTNARSEKQRGVSGREGEKVPETGDGSVFILTGGFPCQPFSQAGRRKGTSDDRFLWPEMFRVIREFHPLWVIAENVRGILTIEQGMVFEQVCADLESEGYSVQPFVIPAVAANAPHRRDRIWFVANRHPTDDFGRGSRSSPDRKRVDENQQEREESWSQPSRCDEDHATHTSNERLQRNELGRSSVEKEGSPRPAPKPTQDASDPKERGSRGLREVGEQDGEAASGRRHNHYDWNLDWYEVATDLCRVDDGLPARMDGLELSKSAHRVQRLKALGNAIVPQVAIEIMKSIKAFS